MSQQGWIKIHRKLRECYLWQDKEPFDKRSAWIDLLLSTNHTDNKTIMNNKVIVIKRGTFITSEVKLAEKWKWDRGKVRRFLTLLQSDNMISKTAKARLYITIGIINYDQYQSKDLTENFVNELGTTGNEIDNKNATSTIIDNTKVEAIDTTSKEQVANKYSTSSEQVANINKNDKECTKNVENEKKEYIYSQEKEIFDYWNSKKGTVTSKESSFDKSKIATVIKHFKKEEIVKAIEQLNNAVLDPGYYYNFKWNIYKFFKQANGISNWVEDGQLLNDYRSKGEGGNNGFSTKHTTASKKEVTTECEGDRLSRIAIEKYGDSLEDVELDF